MKDYLPETGDLGKALLGYCYIFGLPVVIIIGAIFLVLVVVFYGPVFIF